MAKTNSDDFERLAILNKKISQLRAEKFEIETAAGAKGDAKSAVVAELNERRERFAKFVSNCVTSEANKFSIFKEVYGMNDLWKFEFLIDLNIALAGESGIRAVSSILDQVYPERNLSDAQRATELKPRDSEEHELQGERLKFLDSIESGGHTVQWPEDMDWSLGLKVRGKEFDRVRLTRLRDASLALGDSLRRLNESAAAERTRIRDIEAFFEKHKHDSDIELRFKHLRDEARTLGKIVAERTESIAALTAKYYASMKTCNAAIEFLRSNGIDVSEFT